MRKEIDDSGKVFFRSLLGFNSMMALTHLQGHPAAFAESTPIPRLMNARWYSRLRDGAVATSVLPLSTFLEAFLDVLHDVEIIVPQSDTVVILHCCFHCLLNTRACLSPVHTVAIVHTLENIFGFARPFGDARAFLWHSLWAVAACWTERRRRSRKRHLEQKWLDLQLTFYKRCL